MLECLYTRANAALPEGGCVGSIAQYPRDLSRTVIRIYTRQRNGNYILVSIDKIEWSDETQHRFIAERGGYYPFVAQNQ